MTQKYLNIEAVNAWYTSKPELFTAFLIATITPIACTMMASVSALQSFVPLGYAIPVMESEVFRSTLYEFSVHRSP